MSRNHDVRFSMGVMSRCPYGCGELAPIFPLRGSFCCRCTNSLSNFGVEGAEGRGGNFRLSPLRKEGRKHIDPRFQRDTKCLLLNAISITREEIEGSGTFAL